MTKKVKIPNYIRIAIDIAHRIVKNEFAEGSKITGRTTLVSIYQVSPETIRRSIALLKDMDVVTVNEKSGIIINSRKKAVDFLNKFKTQSDFNNLKSETFELLNEKKKIDNEIEQKLNSIIKFATQLRNVGTIIPFESTVPVDSSIIGKSIGELNFWHHTKATIIGVKRDNETFLSPGPYFTLLAKDILIYVGNDEVLENVENYMINPFNRI
ncbi:TrkA C-terminal domain-containing protein [Clostridium sp. ATCC 25772]|uniref:TrkA C-terminal domain-containing protein n=1 Tax=Clostridium sp. ATCC 25772 TaxID=1676991 RepID=UPI0007857FE3|nr:TrkA C-terminal domain-containing protein [Clostridium sp. ATCC 25772]